MDDQLVMVLQAICDQQAAADGRVRCANNEDLVAATGLSAKAVAKALNQLHEAGFIEGAQTFGDPSPHLMQICLLAPGLRALELIDQQSIGTSG